MSGSNLAADLVVPQSIAYSRALGELRRHPTGRPVWAARPSRVLVAGMPAREADTSLKRLEQLIER